MSFTFIDATAHGFVANAKIGFSNLDGGQGIIEGDPYYVLAAGLTADTFQFSETVGGAAFAFDTAITSGSVTAWATYTVAADGIQDPPTALGDPGQPVLDSDVTTGTVRVLVTIPTVTDARIRHTEFQMTDEYSVPASAPDAPVFTNAMTRQLLPGVTTFSVAAHPNTWYSARVRNVDVYGNASAWSVAFSGPNANIETVDGLDSLISASLDHLVDTVEINPGAVTADLLAGTIILGSTIIAGDPSDQHVEMNDNGIILFDASDAPVVVIPTDGTLPVSVSGNITAGTLTVTGAAELRDATSLPPGATVVAQGTTAAPTAAPVLTQSWDAYPHVLGTLATTTPRRGISYSTAGGAGGATKVFYAAEESNLNIIAEYLASTGAVNRTKDISAQFNTGTLVPTVTQFGAYIYVLSCKIAASSYRVCKYDIATLTLQATYDAVTMPTSFPDICAITSDGTNIYIVGATGSTVKFRAYDAVMATAGALITTNATSSGIVRGATVGNADFGAWRCVAVTDSLSTCYVFNAAGTRQTTEEFTVPTTATSGGAMSILYGDPDGSGARFWSQGTYFPFNGLLTKHTNWTWTSGSDVHWAGYAWYDSVGTTHETAMGTTRASVTMLKRKRLQIATSAIPVGAAGPDDPDKVRIYVLKSASDTGAGTFWLQTTDSATSRYIESYTGSGTHDGAGTVFSAGTAATISSGSTGWSLKGDGSIKRTGTVFPSGPVAGDSFVRSDLNYIEFVYDGTRWLSRDIFETYLGGTGPAASLAATTSNLGWGPLGDLKGGSDAWLLNAEVFVFVNTGGTALGASHKWVFALDKSEDSTTGLTNLTSHSIASGANGGRYSTVAINALLNNGTIHDGFRYGVTKTGTPGAIFCNAKVTYRIVAT